MKEKHVQELRALRPPFRQCQLTTMRGPGLSSCKKIAVFVGPLLAPCALMFVYALLFSKQASSQAAGASTQCYCVI